MSAGALLVSVSLAACGADASGSSSATGRSSPPDGVTASSKAPASDAPEAGIPAAALLQPSDVRDAEPEPLKEGVLGHLRPLRPCGDSDAYPSDDSRTAAVAVSYAVGPGSGEIAPTVLVEFLGRHSPGGANDQFDEISEALRRCPGSLAGKQRRWTVLDTDVAGDESVLVRIDQKMTYGDEEPDTVSDYAAVARTADMIVVVTDTGWENSNASETLVRELLDKAVQRAGTVG